MLQNIRDNMNGLISYGIVGLVIVTFGLFGVEALFLNVGLDRGVVAEVNKRKITETELRRAMEMQKQQFRSMMGEQIDARFLQDEFVRGPSLENLIRRNVLVTEAEKRKMTVSDMVLDQKIVADKTFSPAGSFDKDYYVQLLQGAGFTPVSYREQLREDFIANQFQYGVTRSSFVTPAEVDAMVELLHQTRSFSYIRLSADDFRAGLEASEEEIGAYYQSNQDRYLSEETVKVDYVFLTKKALLPTVYLEEADIQAQYDSELATFESNIERHAAHILIEEQDDGSHQAVLAEISNRLAAGEDFASLAMSYSVDVGSAESGGDVGYTRGDVFVPEFEQALAALEVGAVSEPVSTQFGFHFIKLLDVQQSKPPTLEESRKRIERELKASLVENLYVEKLEQMRNVSYDANDLEEVAIAISDSEFQASKQSSPAFSRMGTDGPFRNPAVISAAFAEDFLDGLANSEVLELSESEALVMRKVEHNSPKILPLEAVRDRIAEHLVEEKAQALALQKANDLRQMVEAGKTLEAVAKEQDLDWQLALDKERNSSGVDRQILEAVFKLPKPETSAVIDVTELPAGDVLLVSLTDYKKGADAISDEQKEAVARQLESRYQREDVAAWEAVMRAQATIEQRQPEES